MSLADQPFVGNPAARAVHGHSAGALTVVLTGQAVLAPAVTRAPVEATLRELGLEPTALVTEDATGEEGSAWLGRLANAAVEAAEAGAPALVVASADLDISAVALLDLLDRPGDPTAVATIEPDVLRSPVPEGGPVSLPMVRVDRHKRRVHSVGTARHTVTDPTGHAVGVLRVARRDLEAAGRAWQAAAASQAAADPAVDPFDLALLALVRAGVPVGAVPLGPFGFSRGTTHVPGAPGSAWQQRLRGASRGGDGFFSTFAVRPLSRRLTGFGLAHGWSPNVVTICSLLLGLVASALAAVDNRWAWAAAAVLLLLALVVDCVDGEIARFTRRFSALGAWLDAVGDRVKEYSLIAAVAWVGARRGDPVWLLAITALALVTVRHLEDYAHADRTRASFAHLEPDQLPVDEPWDRGPRNARLTVPGRPSRRAQAVHWAKKVVHLPIAERYLVLALALLTFEPAVVLWAITVAVVVALLWTQGGRTTKALLHRDGFRAEGLPDGHWAFLDHQLDLGPVARQFGRVVRLPFAAGVAGGLLVCAAAGVVLVDERFPWYALAVGVAGWLLAGAGFRPPLQHPLAWQVPALLWLAEAGLVLALTASLPGPAGWVGYAYLAAVAWHRYDVVYRLRDTGLPAASWVTAVTLGADGRWVALALVALLDGPVRGSLAWASLALFCVYAAESASGWRAWVRAEHPAVLEDEDVDSELAR